MTRIIPFVYWWLFFPFLLWSYHIGYFRDCLYLKSIAYLTSSLDHMLLFWGFPFLIVNFSLGTWIMGFFFLYNFHIKVGYSDLWFICLSCLCLSSASTIGNFISFYACISPFTLIVGQRHEGSNWNFGRTLFSPTDIRACFGWWRTGWNSFGKEFSSSAYTAFGSYISCFCLFIYF